MATAAIDPPLLFDTLRSDCKPIADLFRNYSEAHPKFIAEGTRKLLDDGIIE